MNRYNAQILNDKGEYHLQFETDSREKFDAMERLAQKCMDNKPKTNYDKITESAESLAEFIYKVRFNCALSDYGCDYCILKELGDCNETNIKEWLQKECEDEKNRV